ARSIFLSEIPVISAVGHESDVTIADYVADKRAATPTDAADIAASDKEALQSLAKETARILRRSVDDILQKAEEKTRRYDMNAMKTQILDRLRWKSLIIENHLLEIEQEVKRILALAEAKTEKAKIELTAANPLEIMKKGYGLILDQEGRISSSALRFTQGDSLTVIFKDGKINCHVDRVRGSENEAEK
ncbi:MAG: exodeoxyribonuclease VII large subunit, partial [Eubacteriales bacterium]|nr:exodeoxyribonuclease VII large subunit [Eubacteriales bacterium]